MRCSGESEHQPGVPEKGLESPSQNAEGSREWGGWREPEPAAAHPCGPPAQGVWKRKNREAEKQKDPGRRTSGNQDQEDNGGKHRMEAVPEAQTIKAPPKPLGAVGAPREPGKGSIFCFTSPFIVCTRVGGICLLHCSTAHIF